MVLKKHKLNKKSFISKASVFGWLVVFMCFSNAVSAKTLNQYKENVQHLQRDFAKIVSEDVDDDFIQKVFEEIPDRLPVEEKIELGEASLDVSNKWLSQEVSNYEKETDTEKKELILTAIYERLEAIEAKINELENAAEDGITKDEEKRKLAEILRREEFQKPAEKESWLQTFLTWLDEWIKKNFPKKDNAPQKMPSSNFGGVIYFMQILLYVLVIGILGFLIYKFAPFFIKKFRERERSDKNDRIILGEKISANETPANLFSEAEELAKKGNLRDAIRKGYIAFLFELSERKLIGLAKHKTNRDYLHSVRKKRELYEHMNGLTSNYERHWYGFENANEDDWQDFREKYNDAIRNK